MPPSVYSSVSSSASVADTAPPIFTPEPMFSATERVVLSLANAGARFSSTSVTVIVTSMLSLFLPSEAVIVTEYEVSVS